MTVKGEPVPWDEHERLVAAAYERGREATRQSVLRGLGYSTRDLLQVTPPWPPHHDDDNGNRITPAEAATLAEQETVAHLADPVDPRDANIWCSNCGGQARWEDGRVVHRDAGTAEKCGSYPVPIRTPTVPAEPPTREGAIRDETFEAWTRLANVAPESDRDGAREWYHQVFPGGLPRDWIEDGLRSADASEQIMRAIAASLSITGSLHGGRPGCDCHGTRTTAGDTVPSYALGHPPHHRDPAPNRDGWK